MPRRGSILLVDDEEKILKALGRALRDAGHEVIETVSARQGQRLLVERTFDVCIVDNVMPELSGLELIREYVASTPEGERAQVLMITAHATVESAIEAMKLGALDYLQKPFEIDELLVVVQAGARPSAAAHRVPLPAQRAGRAVRSLRHHRQKPRDGGHHPPRRAGGRDQEHRAHQRRDRHGQGAVARAIHDRSAQRDMPLIKVNCAAIPESLLESELFGHVRGAFTGATTTKKGKFALADGGSIFLDASPPMFRYRATQSPAAWLTYCQ